MKRPLYLTLLCCILCGSLTLAVAQDGVTPPAPTEPPASAETIVATAPPDDVTPTPVPRPNPVTTMREGGVTADVFFESIRQGRAGLVRVDGADVTEVSGLFANRVVPFFRVEGDEAGFYGLIAVSMEQAARTYPLELYATIGSGGAARRVTLRHEVRVELGGFLGEAVDLPTERAYLASADVERNEFARLNAVFETYSEGSGWTADGGFRLPISAALTSRFGAVRTLNGTFPTRHTGWDMTAATGTPVKASAAGRVAFAGLLDIRGNHVVIDHGAGVFSGYSHLSVIHVTRGEQVAQGQIIGLSGNTGRSSGPHLHWEITVNGEFVDSVDFLQMWLP